MKSFTERNPLVIGILVLAIIAAGTTGALALNSGVFQERYRVHARFSDTAGLRAGDTVRVAGVTSGRVGSVRQHEDEVDVELEIDDGIELPHDVRAEIVVETLLGSKYVRLVGGDQWDRLLRNGDLITDTSTPTEVLDVQEAGAPLLEETDTDALNDLFGKIDEISSGQRDNVGELITGLNRLLGAVNSRQAEARRLIGSSRTVADTLADRDEQLLDAVDDLNVVLDGLSARRARLVELLQATESSARNTADLVHDNRAQLDVVLDEIHKDLEVVDRNQANLAESLAGMTNAISGFASVGYSGVDEFPNTWANMYTQLVGPIGPDALFGSCGLLDEAFDVLIGPDPVTSCEARTGPLPAGESDGAGQGTDPLEALYGPIAGAGG